MSRLKGVNNNNPLSGISTIEDYIDKEFIMDLEIAKQLLEELIECRDFIIEDAYGRQYKANFATVVNEKLVLSVKDIINAN